MFLWKSTDFHGFNPWISADFHGLNPWISTDFHGLNPWISTDFHGRRAYRANRFKWINTVKVNDNFPFISDVNPSYIRGRRVIDKKGTMGAYWAERVVKVGNKTVKVYGLAFCSGTDKVTLLQTQKYAFWFLGKTFWFSSGYPVWAAIFLK